MLRPFARKIRQRLSGTDKNEPPTSLILFRRRKRFTPWFQAATKELARYIDIFLRPAGRTKKTRYLIRQREQTACWQLSCSTPITGGVAPGMPSRRNSFRRNRYTPFKYCTCGPDLFVKP